MRTAWRRFSRGGSASKQLSAKPSQCCRLLSAADPGLEGLQRRPGDVLVAGVVSSHWPTPCEPAAESLLYVQGEGARGRARGRRAPSQRRASTGSRRPRTATATGGDRHPPSRRASRRAGLLRLQRHRPPHSSPPARPYAVDLRPLPLLELLHQALAQRHGHLGHIRRSRSAPWPRPLPQSSSHHLPPARAAEPRRSHVWSTRSPLIE